MITINATRIVFKADSNTYDYVLTKAQGLRHAVLKIRVTRKLMDKFRNSAVGREIAHMVDIFEQGGGWYEITDADFYVARMLRRGYKDFASGIMTWIRAFNVANLPPVTKYEQVVAAPAAVHSPNPQRDLVKPVTKAPAPKTAPLHSDHLLAMAAKLANRFGKTVAA